MRSISGRVAFTASRRSDLSPTRRALLLAGVATVAVSLVMSIAPAFAKNPSSGTVKLHDVTTGTDVPDTNNDPTVCTFTVIFQFSGADTSGTWAIRSWQPTGDGSVVASGTYDTSPTGTDETAAIDLAAGHYRLEYLADGAHGAKTKTFWVGDGCGAGSDASSAPSSTPSSDPSDSPSSSPSESPSDSPSDSPSEQPSSDPSTDPSAPAVVIDPTPTPQPSDVAPNDPATPTATPSQAASSSESPSEEEQVAAAIDNNGGGSPSGDATQGGTEGTGSMPNTAAGGPAGIAPWLTALGLLMIVGAHPFLRRSASGNPA
jgi:hypothetical protein